MIEATLFTCLLLFTSYYFFFLQRVQNGLQRLKDQPRYQEQPFVSIVVAARNEEENISTLLESLLHQQYPADKFEIIIIDDGSTDATVQRIKEFQLHHSHIVLLHTSDNPQYASGSKTKALELGIRSAQGEIIATTDADCLVPDTWIATLAQYFSESTAMVAGPITESSPQSFFNHLERLEFLGLIAVGAGLIGARRPIICNGANLAYRKTAFEKVQGFGNTGNDDEALMQRFIHRNIGSIAFASAPEAMVQTRSQNTVKTFFLQRMRWAKKRGQYEDPSVLFSVIGLFLFFVSIAAVGIASIYDSQYFLPFFFVIVLKTGLEYRTLKIAAVQWKQNIPLLYFLVAEVLHVPYILLAAAAGQIGTLHWKGRSIA